MCKRIASDQTAALRLGSRIVVDPRSDGIEMLKRQPVRPLSLTAKMPFGVFPLCPYLKRRSEPQKLRPYLSRGRVRESGL
jgi:hypothetical protein